MAQLTHPRSPLWPVDPRSLPSVEEQTAECECEQTERLESCIGTFFIDSPVDPCSPNMWVWHEFAVGARVPGDEGDPAGRRLAFLFLRKDLEQAGERRFKFWRPFQARPLIELDSRMVSPPYVLPLP